MSEPNLFDLAEQGQHRAKPEPSLLITVEQLAARLNLSALSDKIIISEVR